MTGFYKTNWVLRVIIHLLLQPEESTGADQSSLRVSAPPSAANQGLYWTRVPAMGSSSVFPTASCPLTHPLPRYSPRYTRAHTALSTLLFSVLSRFFPTYKDKKAVRGSLCVLRSPDTQEPAESARSSKQHSISSAPVRYQQVFVIS